VQKPTVLPKQENLRLPNNWTLIFEMGFLALIMASATPVTPVPGEST